MYSLVQTLLKICVFRAKPHDLPPSHRLLTILAIVTFIGYYTGNSLLPKGSDPTHAIWIALSQTVSLGGGLWMVLIFYRKKPRWLQSATALYGASAITTWVALPILLSIAGDQQSLQEFPMLIWLLTALRIWFFAISIFILKETIEVSTGVAIIISIALQLFFAVLLAWVFT